MKVDWVDDRLAISGSIDDYNQLLEEQIDIVINLRAEMHDDINELTKRKIQYYWIPIPDWSAPRSAQVKLFVDLIRYLNGRILVHCEVGMGRSVCLCIAYLLENNVVYTVKEGIEYMQRIRPMSKMWHTQLDKLLLLYD